MIFDMTRRVSGGGGPTTSDAILTVTVPTDSTVTATKGGVTLTPTIWVQAADNTLDCALFVIGPSLFDSQNAWTVTATLGTDTALDYVTIDSNKEYSVELGFDFYFVKNGVVKTGYTIEAYTGSGITIESVSDGSIRISRSTGNGSNSQYVYFNPRYDFSAKPYNYLVFDYKVEHIYCGAGSGGPKFGLIESVIASPVYAGYTLIGPGTATVLDDQPRTYKNLDISSIKTEDYVNVFIPASASHAPSIKIYNMYLSDEVPT